MIWDVFLNNTIKKETQVRETIKSLLNLFCIQYKPSIKKKRRFILYFAISLLIEQCNWSIPIYTDKDKTTIENIKKKIDVIYKEIKKNEIKPGTDYLFNNSICKTKNLENTLNKLDKMGSMTGFIPRINK